MRRLLKFLRVIPLTAIVLVLAYGVSIAQTPSVDGPYNVPQGSIGISVPPAAASNQVFVNTLQTPATLTKFYQNLAYEGISCTFNQTAASGSPTTTIEVDAFDAASQSYTQLVVSGAITATATPTTIQLYPAIAQTHAVTGMVSQALHLPRFFRVKEVVADQGSTGAATTGTVGCDLLK